MKIRDYDGNEYSGCATTPPMKSNSSYGRWVVWCVFTSQFGDYDEPKYFWKANEAQKFYDENRLRRA